MGVDSGTGVPSRMLPSLATAKHRKGVGHEIASSPAAGSTRVANHAGCVAVGGH